MGIIYSLLRNFMGKKDVRILLVGLDGAGKTTVLYKLLLGEGLRSTVPTIGFNVETVEYKNISFTMWDIGGGHRIQQIWRHYCCNAAGVIFVVDSADRERIEEARDGLMGMLKTRDELRNVVILVLANKQDLPFAMSTAEVTEKLGLKGLSDRRWHVQATCATSGQGLYEGLDWLSEEFNS